MPYSEMHANAPVGGCGCFWMNGGDGDFFVPLWLNFSGVVEAGGHTTDRIANFDTGLNLFYGMGGIRMRLPNTRSSGRSAEGFWRSAWVRQLLPTPVGKLPTSYGVSCALPLEAAWINRGLGTYLDPRDPDQLLLLRTPQSTREPPAPVRTRRGDRVRIAGKVGFYLVLNAPKSLWTVQMPSRIAYGASATRQSPLTSGKGPRAIHDHRTIETIPNGPKPS
jgi:hypothetical protein